MNGMFKANQETTMKLPRNPVFQQFYFQQANFNDHDVFLKAFLLVHPVLNTRLKIYYRLYVGIQASNNLLSSFWPNYFRMFVLSLSLFPSPPSLSYLSLSHTLSHNKTLVFIFLRCFQYCKA
jgi:hypothetical protein